MKRIALRSIVSITAFFLGVSTAWSPTDVKIERSAEPEFNFSKPQAAKLNGLSPEFTNVSLPNGLRFIDLLLVYDGESSVGRLAMEQGINKSWLGLFKRGNKYSLERRSATFGKLVKSDFGDFYPVRFRDAERALFLISDEDGFTPGRVTTLYQGPSDEELENQDLPFELMEFGFRREFHLDGKRYTLRVAPGTSEEGFPLSVLVLESSEKNQIVWYKQYSEASRPSAVGAEAQGGCDERRSAAPG